MAAERNHRNGGRFLSRPEIEKRLADAFAETFPQYAAPAKTVAHGLGVSPRTVENLRQRIPDAMVTIIMAGQMSPTFGLQVAELMGIEIDSPRGYAMYLELQRSIIERLK